MGQDEHADIMSDLLAAQPRRVKVEAKHVTPSACQDSRTFSTLFKIHTPQTTTFVSNSIRDRRPLPLLKMKYIFSQEQLVIPEDVKVHIRSRIVTVEGPRGTKFPRQLDRSNPGSRRGCKKSQLTCAFSRQTHQGSFSHRGHLHRYQG